MFRIEPRRLPRARRRRRRRSGSGSALLALNRMTRGQRPAGSRVRTRRRSGRSSSGIAGMPPARSCGASSTATRSGSDGCSRMCPPMPRSGGRAAGGGRLPGDSRRERQDRRAAAAAAGGRAARHRDRAGGRGVRHGDRRRGPRRPGSRRVRRVRRAPDDRDRARGARRPGGHVLPDRELPRLPLGRLGRRACEPRAAAGAPARRRDPRHPPITRIDAATRQVHLDGGDVLRARTIILACGVAWRRLDDRGLRRASPARASSTAPRAAKHANTHGLDVHIIGAGNSAGQAAMFFSTHARSVTILYRGDSLEKSMSQYLIEQIATRPNIHVLLSGRGRRRARRRAHSRRSTSATPRPARRPARVGRPVHLHRRRRRDRLAAAGDRTRRERLRAHRRRLRAAGRWQLDRDPYLLETSVPGIFACGDVRYSPVKRVAAAVGEGSMAIAFVHQYLREHT